MYKVALCEDEQFFLDAQEKTCRDILEKNGIEYHLDTFGSGTDFLSVFLNTRQCYDLVLLDIVMDGLDGMELAQEIRKQDRQVTIIFITSSMEYALQGYDVNAFHYLVKPLDGDVLERLILSDYRNRFQNSFLTFQSGAHRLRVATKDIVRLETVGRRVAITLVDRVVYYPGKLTELLEKLPADQFIRCHKAFAINIGNTRELTRQSAFSDSGVETPVSRTFVKDVQKAFLRNIRES